MGARETNRESPDIIIFLALVLFYAVPLIDTTMNNNMLITVNSRIKLKNLSNSREAEITLVSPQDADPRQSRVSVLSEIGLALLGRKENDIVSWQVPNGKGEFRVEKVVYQPGATGDYIL